MRSTRRLPVAAPLLICAYGILRLIGKADGRYGPGLDWQAAHVAALAGMVLFLGLVPGLARLLPRTPWRAAAVGATVIGLVCTVVQFGADIVTGLLAADHAEMRSLSQRFHDIPGVTPAFYTVGPQLFFLGIVALAVLLAVARRVPWWSPVLLLVGVVLSAATLNLLPLTGLLILAALWPAGAAQHRRQTLAA